MTKNTIDLIFDELKTRGQCNSRSSFSNDWLGRESSYYRSLHSKGLKPSVDAQLNLAARLRHLGAHLKTSDHPKLATTGKVYLQLYVDLIEALLDQAQSDTANAGFNPVRL